jgi:Tol biopolymer transport system component/DNA-binding winged helix-turn-helix (wHTH) protein
VAGPVYQFADFRLDCGSFELRRNGTALRVERMPMELLILLVSRQGQLVTRAEITQHLWSSEVFVDTEHGINTAIRKIRYVLRDDPERPRILQTVTGKGYRIICPVEGSEQRPEVEAPPAVSLPSPQLPPAEGDGKPKRTYVMAIGLALLGMAILIAAAWYWYRPRPQLRVTGYNPITHDGRPKDLAGTDGSRIYFNRNYDPQRTAQVAISGGEIAQVPVALPLPWINDVSPDGSTLLVTSSDGGQGSLWNVQVPAGTLRRLLTDARVVSAAWSPDGKSVVYSTNGDLYVMKSDGTGTHKLAAVGGLPDELSWSPDGREIRFSKDNRLWEMSPDGTGLHPLLPGWHTSVSQCCGRWTPDGKFFVFLSRGAFYAYNGFVDASQLWVLDERRSLFRRAPTEPVQLTSGPIRWNTPIPSKDGTKIFAHGVILRGELDRYDAQSSRPQPWLGGISADQVTFSRDGQFVAYVTFPEGILWRANRDGSRPVQLTDSGLYPLNPSWSPDGSQILFCNYDSKGHVEAYVISSQGGTPRPLLPDDREGQSDPSWSPDGQKILFSTLEKFGAFDSFLRVLDLASHRVTTVPGSEGAWSAQWSPNGRFILAMSAGRTGGMKIFDFETQRWIALRAGDSDFPTWSSDSQFIYFLLPYDNPGVFRIRVSGGDAERIVDLKGFRYTGAFTLWMGLDPTDTPMLLRDVGTDDIYALTLETK